MLSISLGNPDIEITAKFNHGAAVGQAFMLYIDLHIQEGNKDRMRMRVAAAVVDSNIIWRK